jgi:hypothetical protein
MERTARRSPEVVVRITGRQNGGGHILANFAYISRLGHGDDVQVPLYTSDGDVLRDGKDMQVLAQDWQEWESRWRGQAQGATSISMVLSMPAKTDPEALKASALDFARENLLTADGLPRFIWIAITRTFTLRLRAATKTAGASIRTAMTCFVIASVSPRSFGIGVSRRMRHRLVRAGSIRSMSRSRQRKCARRGWFPGSTRAAQSALKSSATGALLIL